MGGGRSLSAWPLHVIHGGIMVSGSEISYLTGSFQEKKSPGMSHLQYSTGQNLSEGLPIEEEGIHTPPLKG